MIVKEDCFVQAGRFIKIIWRATDESGVCKITGKLSLADVFHVSTFHQFSRGTWPGNEVLPQDTTRLIQRPCYQRGSPCQDPAGNWTTRRPPDDRKKTQTAVVWSCFPFIKSGQNHFARHSERGKKTRQTGEEVEDNITEWTGLEFGKSQRAVENREKWRKLDAKSSVVPQRPSRLRD